MWSCGIGLLMEGNSVRNNDLLLLCATRFQLGSLDSAKLDFGRLIVDLRYLGHDPTHLERIDQESIHD